MKPLVIASTGRAIAALDALTNASQGDRVEVRRVPLLPAPHSLDGERPTVVLADRTLFDAELARVQAYRNTMTSLVQLYKALGGGWQVVAAAEPAAGH